MGLITLPDSNFDDGNLTLIPQMWTKGSSSGSGEGVTAAEVKKIISQTVEEKNDKLMVDGKEKGVDNYVRSGKLEDNGNLKLNLGEDKEADIDLSDLQTQSLTSDDIRNAAAGKF